MDIAVISIIVLCVIAVAIISFFAGLDKWRTDVTLLEADLTCQKSARKELARRYDELYDTLLRVNKSNTELQKKLNDCYNNYDNAADVVYDMYMKWYSRKELCQIYPNVAYSTLCAWIRKKKKEVLLSDSVNPNESHQGKLL